MLAVSGPLYVTSCNRTAPRQSQQSPTAPPDTCTLSSTPRHRVRGPVRTQTMSCAIAFEVGGSTWYTPP
eukprot:3149356-Rhodomonas_salina.6